MMSVSMKLALVVAGVLAGPHLSAQAPRKLLGKPNTLIVADGMPLQQRTMLTETARTFYSFWTTNDAAQGRSVISPSFTDHDLPPGRPQGPTGPVFANAQFHKAVPDLHCEVLQQIVAGDRVVTNMRFTGHFTGVYGTLHGTGQVVNFVATDILRIVSGRITDNWHIEDNLTFQQQIGIVQR